MPVAPPSTTVVDRTRRPPMRLSRPGPTGGLAAPSAPGGGSGFESFSPEIQNAIRNGLVPGWNPATLQADASYAPGQPVGGSLSLPPGDGLAGPGNQGNKPVPGGLPRPAGLQLATPGGETWGSTSGVQNWRPEYVQGKAPGSPADKSTAQLSVDPTAHRPPVRLTSGSSNPVKNPGAGSRQVAVDAANRARRPPKAPGQPPGVAAKPAPGPAPGAGPFSLPHSQSPIGSTAPPPPIYTKPSVEPPAQTSAGGVAPPPVDSGSTGVNAEQSVGLPENVGTDWYNPSSEVPPPGGGYADGVNRAEVTPGPTVDANGRPLGVAPGSMPRPPMRLLREGGSNGGSAPFVPNSDRDQPGAPMPDPGGPQGNFPTPEPPPDLPILPRDYGPLHPPGTVVGAPVGGVPPPTPEPRMTETPPFSPDTKPRPGMPWQVPPPAGGEGPASGGVGGSGQSQPTQAKPSAPEFASPQAKPPAPPTQAPQPAQVKPIIGMPPKRKPMRLQANQAAF